MGEKFYLQEYIKNYSYLHYSFLRITIFINKSIKNALIFSYSH